MTRSPAAYRNPGKEEPTRDVAGPAPRRRAGPGIPVDERLRSTLPEAAIGNWRVERFTVSEQDASFERMRAFNPSSLGRYTPAGTYTALYHRRALIMSDTPDEIRDHLHFIRRAHGRVLINGLGLGICLGGVLRRPAVERVLVIEIAPKVIKLVGHHFSDPRLEIIQADAFDYRPPRGERFDCAWHDIWNDICADNLEGMKALHRKYGRRTKWQGSWCRGLVERLARSGW